MTVRTGSKKALTKATAATALALVTISWFTLDAPWAGLLLEVEYARAGLTKRSVWVENRSYAYLEGGTGTPVVLLHGFAASKDNWIRFAAPLTKDHRVLALDLPGFGDTPALEGDTFGIEAQAERVHAVLGALSVESALKRSREPAGVCSPEVGQARVG